MYSDIITLGLSVLGIIFLLTVFILRFYDSAKKKIEDLQVKPKKSNEWENLTGSKKAPAGAVYADIMIVTFSTTTSIECHSNSAFAIFATAF